MMKKFKTPPMFNPLTGSSVKKIHELYWYDLGLLDGLDIYEANVCNDLLNEMLEIFRSSIENATITNNRGLIQQIIGNTEFSVYPFSIIRRIYGVTRRSFNVQELWVAIQHTLPYALLEAKKLKQEYMNTIDWEAETVVIFCDEYINMLNT